MNRNTLLKSIFALVLMVMLPSLTTAATETITWIHTDHLGSPIAGRNAAGETTWEQAYAPWGERQAVAGVPQAPEGVGYTGHVYDEQVGLIYAGARWYDPAMGRFISPDAVRFNPGSSSLFNRYVYGNNSPFIFTDPDGRLADIAADIAFIGYSAYTLAVEPSWTNGLALGADIVGAAVPFATGLGVAVRAGKHADGAVTGANKVVAGSAGKADDAVGAATEPNRIYSARELVRRAEEPGPFHNFPESFDDIIFKQGERREISGRYVQYDLKGSLNGRSGVYEMGVKPSKSGRTEVITHRFFRPDPQ